jgi:hypothetical protein
MKVVIYLKDVEINLQPGRVKLNTLKLDKPCVIVFALYVSLEIFQVRANAFSSIRFSSSKLL